MNNAAEEHYAFHRMALGDLEDARRSLAMASRYRRKDAILALIRDAVVAYGRPFSGSRGTLVTNHRLSEGLVPRRHRATHRRTMELRNRLFAHSDVKFRRPRLRSLGDGDDRVYWILMRGQGAYFEDFLTHAEAMRDLVPAVYEILLARLEAMETTLSGAP